MIILYSILAKKFDHAISRIRWDGSPAYPYFKASDFGVNEKPFFFYSGPWKLQGSRYAFGPGPYKAILVVFHGIGSGRNAYVKPICLFAKEGYLVYAFDYTGCMQSEGPYIYGLGQVGKDQKAFFDWLDQDPEAQGLDRFVLGHSWGGYAALLASNPVYKVKKIISIAGFNRVSDEYKAIIPQLKSKLLLFLTRFYLWVRLGKWGDKKASDVVRKSACSILYIQGDKDNVVPLSVGTESLKKELPYQKNITFKIVPGRGHQCFLSIESEDYVNYCFDHKLNSPEGDQKLRMNLEKAGEENKELVQTMFDFLAH
jgi:pimeloyl-ACP methyl ester carboxylesterase